MLTKKEGKWRLSVTSVWFFALILSQLIFDILSKDFDWLIFLGAVGLSLYFAFFEPGKKIQWNFSYGWCSGCLVLLF